MNDHAVNKRVKYSFLAGGSLHWTQAETRVRGFGMSNRFILHDQIRVTFCVLHIELIRLGNLIFHVSR